MSDGSSEARRAKKERDDYLVETAYKIDDFKTYLLQQLSQLKTITNNPADILLNGTERLEKQTSLVDSLIRDYHKAQDALKYGQAAAWLYRREYPNHSTCEYRTMEGIVRSITRRIGDDATVKIAVNYCQDLIDRGVGGS